MKSETKVGIFVLAAIAALGWLSYQSGSGVGGADYSRELKTEFGDVGGITPGSAVRMAGVKVGEVTGVKLLPTGVAEVKMRLLAAEELQLPATIEAQITSDGIIGEKFVNLRAQTLPEGVLPPELAAGTGAIPATSSTAGGMNDIAGNFAALSADLQDVASALRGSLGGAENAARLERIMGNIDGMTSRFNDILAGVQDGKGTLGGLLSDDTMAQDLRTAMAELRQITEKVNSGNGTLGRLINDDNTLTKIEEAIDNLGGVATRYQQFQTEIDIHGYQLLGEDAGKGRFSITFAPRPTRFYVLGVTGDGIAADSDDNRNPNGRFGQDFGKEVKFTAQFGQVFERAVFGKDVTARFGIYDSTFGTGVDMAFWDNRLKLSVDAYDFDGRNAGNADGKAHVDLTARYYLQNGLYLIGGVDNVINDELMAPFIGAGYRFGDDDLKYLLGAAL